MSVLVVPALDEKLWPSLGAQVCDWIEENLTFGPGDLLGQPAIVDDELRAYIHALYQVHPRHTAEQGRRRIKRAGLSLPKGSRKTEFAGWIALAELDPTAPVRCIGWDRKDQPRGGPVGDPFIPMVAYSQEQSEDLAYGAMLAILSEENCRIREHFDAGLSRILRSDGAGKAAPYASAPNSRDGARTTFQHFDETHHMTSDRLKKAHRAMLRNIPKRKLADGWTLETTTAPVPGAGSVAEDLMEYARAVADGRVKDPSLFFYHRQASDTHNLTTVKGLRSAVREARGPIASKWADIRSIVGQFKDPTADRSELARTWLNRPDKASDRAFDAEQWKSLGQSGHVPVKGAMITLGFDGSRYEDATALVGTEIVTGFQWPLGIWEKPLGPRDGPRWEVPAGEVNAAVERAFETWEVWKLYADPPYWETHVDDWAGTYGEERVVKWLTRNWRKIADAVRAYAQAIQDGELGHDGNGDFARHIGNAHKRLLDMRDEDHKPVWIIQKERPGSPLKIDAAMAGVLSWQARRDAMAAGVVQAGESEYDRRHAAGQPLVDSW